MGINFQNPASVKHPVFLFPSAHPHANRRPDSKSKHHCKASHFKCNSYFRTEETDDALWELGRVRGAEHLQVPHCYDGLRHNWTLQVRMVWWPQHTYIFKKPFTKINMYDTKLYSAVSGFGVGLRWGCVSRVSKVLYPFPPVLITSISSTRFYGKLFVSEFIGFSAYPCCGMCSWVSWCWGGGGGGGGGGVLDDFVRQVVAERSRDGQGLHLLGGDHPAESHPAHVLQTGNATGRLPEVQASIMSPATTEKTMVTKYPIIPALNWFSYLKREYEPLWSRTAGCSLTHTNQMCWLNIRHTCRCHGGLKAWRVNCLLGKRWKHWKIESKLWQVNIKAPAAGWTVKYILYPSTPEVLYRIQLRGHTRTGCSHHISSNIFKKYDILSCQNSLQSVSGLQTCIYRVI